MLRINKLNLKKLAIVSQWLSGREHINSLWVSNIMGSLTRVSADDFWLVWVTYEKFLPTFL